MRRTLSPCLPVLASLTAVAATPLAAQQAQAFLEPYRGPVLLLLGQAPQGPRPLDARQAALQEGLEELSVVDLTGPESAALRGELARHLGLKEARWALVAPGGRLLAQGLRHVDARHLVGLLEAHGLQTPIQRLQAFLRRRPDHLEARRDLLHRLRSRAEQLTRRTLGDAALARPLPDPRRGLVATVLERLPKAEARLSPEDDRLIWGSYARELDRAYRTGDWLALSLPPYNADADGLTSPDAAPLDAASPLMQGLYRRHRGELLAILRATPADSNLLHHWLWTSAALREPLLAVFETLPPPKATPGGMSGWRQEWPGETVRATLVAEARMKEDWPRLRRLLAGLWRDGAERRRGTGGEHLERLWQQDWRLYALPALDACLRGGTPGEADAILDGLAGSPVAASCLAEAASLARQLGHPDLAEAWISRALPPTLPESLHGAPCLLVVTTPAGPRRPLNLGGPDGYLIRVRSLHPDSLPSGALAQAWRRYLGWAPDQDAWALVDAVGKVILRGEGALNAPQAQKDLDALGLPAPGRVAFKRLTDPWLRALSAPLELAALQAERYAGQGNRDELELRTRLAERLRDLSPVLSEGLWRRAGWRNPAAYALPVLSEFPDGNSLARPWVEALEAELVRRPGASGLWALWSAWVGLRTDPDFAGFLARLEPSPDEAAGKPWPPAPLLEAQVRQARARNRWRDLEQTLHPLWAQSLQAQDRPRQADSWHRIGLPLAEALLRQERGEEADRLLAEATGLLGSREALVGQARAHGYPTLADRWAVAGHRPTP